MAHHFRPDVPGLARTGAIRLALALLMAVCLPAAIHACPVCFQADGSPAVSGIRAAVLVLVGVTTLVLGGFGVFAARLIRRTRDLDR